MPDKKKKRKKKSGSLHSHSQDEDDRASVQQLPNACRVVAENIAPSIAKLVSFIFFLLFCWTVKWDRSAERVDITDGGICDDANSNDASCLISNDDTYKDSRVPKDCGLVMAPSGIPNSGWGIFTLTSRKRGERIMDEGDIVIHITDPIPQYAHEMKHLVWDYLWDGQETGGHYEGARVMTATSGFGFLTNGVPRKASILHGKISVDSGGLKRGKSPGAGAITHYHNRTWIVNKDLDVGEELFIEYGPGWFEERGFDVNISPHKWDVSHLREVGYCLDNMIPGPSLIEEAGRGAFASRDLEEGAVVAPVPLIALSRLSLSMVKERKDGSLVISTQLLQNYCFGHANSSLLLYPYSHGINFVNHDSSPNVRLRWLEESAALFEKPLLELQQTSSRIMLELVAIRPVEKGEEILLNYGRDWEKAWNDHVESWQPRDEDTHHLSAETMNDDKKFFVIRTQQEQQSKPYPVDVFTSCYYKYSDDAKGGASTLTNSAPVRSVAKWKHGMMASRNLRPCIVVEREEAAINDDLKANESYHYTVHILNRPALDDTERIPRGHIHFVTHVPRHAIVFSDKLYTSDQHLENAFRKEIGLGDLFPRQWKDLL